MKYTFAILVEGLVLASAASVVRAATVENVHAAQRPRSNVVEVFYDLVAPEGGVYDVSLAIGGGYVEPPISTLSGDWGADIIPGRNKKIEWDAGADWAQHVGSNFVATVTATRSDADTGPSKGMVRIPCGTNSGTDPYFGAYSLTVESFYMDKTEVTYAHWKRVYNWAVAHGYSFDNWGDGKGNNHPVHSVNWYDCVKWCNARSEMEGRTPAYLVGGAVYRTGQSHPSVNLDGNGYRIPTYVEWMYAARGGLHNKIFPWGNTINHAHANYWSQGTLDTSGPTSDACTCLDPAGSDAHPHPRYSGFHKEGNSNIVDPTPWTSPVGSFKPNGYGLYDMAGNVSEWCTTDWDDWAVSKGGNYESVGHICSISKTTLPPPYRAGKEHGFRCVRSR